MNRSHVQPQSCASWRCRHFLFVDCTADDQPDPGASRHARQEVSTNASRWQRANRDEGNQTTGRGGNAMSSISGMLLHGLAAIALAVFLVTGCALQPAEAQQPSPTAPAMAAPPPGS